jgi:hypothetical protein
MILDKIIRLAKKNGWKQQIGGVVGFSGNVGTNFIKKETQLIPTMMSLRTYLVRYKMAASKPVVFKDDHYFSHCSVPERENDYLNFTRIGWSWMNAG